MDKTEVIISAVDQTKAAFESVSRGLGGIEGALGGINGTAAKIPMIGTAMATVFGGVNFTQVIKGLIDTGDEMNDMSQRTGIAVQSLGAYKMAAEQSGASLGAVAIGVKGLSATMLAHGAEFKKIGIDTQDADKAFRQLADVFASMPDGMEKASLAVKLFGRSGMELIPMLNLGSKGMETAAQQSAEYAKQMAVLAPKADQFNDSLKRISVNFQVIGAELANEVLPSLSKFAEKMAEAQGSGAGFFGAMIAGFKTSDLASKSLQELREQAGALQGKISVLQNNGPLMGGAIKASIASMPFIPPPSRKSLMTMSGA